MFALHFKMKTISQYCQKCRTPNEPGETNCRECGTRLMIVVFPPSMRFDESIVPSYYEDHLLERISLLELRLGQISEQLKQAYDFMSREAKSFQKDHHLMQAFFEAIAKANPELAGEIGKNCLEIRDENIAKTANLNKNERLFKEIFEAHDSKQAELFTLLVREGVKLFNENEEKQAFLNLERAALLSPQNVPLLVFIAESLFRTDKFEEAEKVLEKAYKIAPHNEKILLLCGAVSADEADSETARKFLSVLVNNPKFSVSVNFIRGMLAAAEENWTESLAAFKEALSREETPELLYLTGCVYFQLRQDNNALYHLQKAASINVKFADTWFMQSLIYQGLGDIERTENTREAAFEVKEAGAQCLQYLRKKKSLELNTALPFLHFGKEKKLLSRGSLRLTKFFREQILKSIE